LLGQSLPAVIISFGLEWDRFALSVSGGGGGDFPLLGFFLLVQMLTVDAPLARELRVNLRPPLIY
jgi:hypothetical protein